jgi:hypothetical protein
MVTKNDLIVTLADGEIIDLSLEAKEAYRYKLEVIQLKAQIDKCFLDLGQRLCMISDRRWYKLYDCENFNEYLETLNMSRAWAFELARIHRVYRVGLEIPDDRLANIGVTKLAVMAGHINEHNQERLLDVADEATVTDLQREMGIMPEIGSGKLPDPLLEPGYYYLTKAHGDVADDLTPITKRNMEIYKDETGSLVAKV